ncbi:MAG: hypothetical protein HY332_06660 [Chloroflexi bacterium]|nr:hypothetical protein [Chloroflexota bacterium]
MTTTMQDPTNERAHRRQTELSLILGGYAIVAFVGGGILWLIFGPDVALIGLAVVAGGLALLGLLWLFLRWLERWERSG